MLKKVLLGLGAAILVLVLGAGLLLLRLQALADAQGIESIHWQGLQLSSAGVRLETLVVQQRHGTDGLLEVEVHDVRVRPQGLTGWLPPEAVEVEALHLAWTPPTSTPPDTPRTLPSLQQLEDWLALTPLRASIRHWRLDLPCPAGRCPLQGAMTWQRASAAPLAELTVTAEDQGHRLQLQTSLDQRAEYTQLLLRLLADDRPRLESRHWLSDRDMHLHWLGSLALSGLPEAPWLLEWLARWTSFDPTTLPTPPTAMRLGASWAVDVPRTAPQRPLGELHTSLHLPAPWPVPGLGLLAGDLQAILRSSEGAWRPQALSGGLSLQPEPSLLEGIPASLRPQRLELTVRPVEVVPQAPATLGVAVDLTAEGPLSARLTADPLQLTLFPLTLAMPRAQLVLTAGSLAWPPLSAQGLRADLELSAALTDTALSVSGLPPSVLSASALKLEATPELGLRQLQLTPTHWQLQAARQADGQWRWTASGAHELAIARLEHPQLRPQGWRWAGTSEATDVRTSLQGQLSNDAGLALATRLDWRQDAGTTASVSSEELFLLAGNPLAHTLEAWPSLLELAKGRLQLEGDVALPSQGALRARLQLKARGLAGVYDRTEFTGLTGTAEARVAGNDLQVRLEPMRLEQLNVGLVLGPLQFEGVYHGPLEAPLAGVLRWEQARLGLLGGEVTLAPGVQPLQGSAPPQQVSLRGIELSALLAAYPTEGLVGTGTLDGEMTVRYTDQGLTVEHGQIAARAPGILRFSSPRIEALGRSNPAMQLVSEALKDFHYQLLRSDIRYDEDGLLRLGMRLEGRNPTLERGRPIHFNINLEEDIPALLTSLQLSDRVSETIQRRVQQRLQRAGPGATP